MHSYHPYQTQDPSQRLAGILGQASGGFNQFNQSGLGTMGIQWLLQSLGMGGSSTPGLAHLNALDQMAQSGGYNRVQAASFMGTGGFSEMNNLTDIVRQMAGSYMHDRAGFVQQYTRANTGAGVMAPVFTAGTLSEGAKRHIEWGLGVDRQQLGRDNKGMGDRQQLGRDNRGMGDNIASFFEQAAQTYKEDPGSFGTANLGDVGKVAAEMVRTNREAFKPEGFEGRKEELKQNLQQFTRAAEDLQGVLGGDVLHALDVLNDTFGVNVQATFRNQGDVIARQTSDIVHTARLTGTSVSTIMKTAGVAGNAMEQFGGSRMGSMMVGTMAVQAGQADDLAFIDEGKFRSMQTMRIAGASESQTARRLSGAYAMWRRGPGAAFETEEEARREFEKNVSEATGGDISRINTQIMQQISGAESGVDLMNASYTQTAERYRATDRLATTAAYASQLSTLKKDRTATIEKLFGAGGYNVDINVTEFEKASEEERADMLQAADINLEPDQIVEMLGTTRQVMGNLSKARGYMSEEAYRQAQVGYERMQATQAQVIARRDIMDSLEITGNTGMRGVLDAVDKWRAMPKDLSDMSAKEKTEFLKKRKQTEEQYMEERKRTETNFKKVFATTIGIKLKEDTLRDFGFKTEFLENLEGTFTEEQADEKGKVRGNLVEMMRVSQSGILKEDDQKNLNKYIKTIMTAEDPAKAREAYREAKAIGTQEGIRKNLLEGVNVGEGNLSPSDKIRRAAVLRAIDADSDINNAESLKARVRKYGIGDEEVQTALRKNEIMGNVYGDTTAAAGVSAAKSPMEALSDTVQDILTEIRNAISGEGVSSNTPMADNKKEPPK